MLLLRLRDETRPDHDRIEAELDLLSGELTLARYGRVLARMHWFVAEWEPRATARAGLVADAGGPDRVRRLEDDLRDLSLSPLPRRCDDLPDLSTAARAMGSLYVFEGAALGGQIVARHVRRLLGFPPGVATAYFESRGTHVGRRWAAFRQALTRISSPGVDDEIVDAARQTFGCLHRVLGEGAHALREAAPG